MSDLTLTLLALAVVVTTPFGLAFVRARKRRARLQSGDRQETADAVKIELEDGTAPPAFRAFALSCLGEFSAARRALLAAPPDAGGFDRDFALCTEILSLGFERDPDSALSRAVELVQLPLQGDEERHRARRLGVVSLVRLLNGVSEEEDWEHLETAIVCEPVMFWPLKYAGAVNVSSQGRVDLVMHLIGEAPRWSDTSLFSQLHVTLTGAPSGRFRKVDAA